MNKSEEYIPKASNLFPVIILRNEEISPGVFLISWERRHPFTPGQVVKIALSEDDEPRIYSICSGNHESEIHVLFNIKPDGELSPRLAACVPGDRIWVSQPYGSFIGDVSPAYWIATGTGIAPFYSMFRSGMDHGKTLIHGARHLNQFYFEDELEWALGGKYIRCCSQEQSPDTFSGRVTDYLKMQENLPQNQKYYLCGNSLMVVEVRDLLIEKGVPYQHIIAEIYF